MSPRVTGDPLDDQPEQVVVGVGVLVARAGGEYRRVGGREVEFLADRPNLRGMVRDLVVDVGGVPFRDPAAVVEQHAYRDLGRVVKATYYVDGQQRGEPGVERQPPLLGELEHHDGNERLHDAAGAEAIGGAHRCGRRYPTEADHARPGAEPGALYVQDRSREVRARIAAGVVKHPL